MSLALWDDLLMICMEFAEDKEIVVIKEMKVIREPLHTRANRKDPPTNIPVPVERPVRLEEVVGYH